MHAGVLFAWTQVMNRKSTKLWWSEKEGWSFARALLAVAWTYEQRKVYKIVIGKELSFWMLLIECSYNDNNNIYIYM